MAADDTDATPVTPDLDELLQVDEMPPMSTVPVRLAEAGTFWRLPNRRVRIEEITVDDTIWQSIVTDSKKRARAVMIAATNPVRIRVSTSGTGMAWPVGVPYLIEHTGQVQVLCATPAVTSVIGVTEEFWAD